jgi:hypothetical protein
MNYCVSVLVITAVLLLPGTPDGHAQTPTDTYTDTPTPNPYVDGWWGDADGDGYVTIADYLAIRDTFGTSYLCQTTCRGLGDANGSGFVNSSDWFAVPFVNPTPIGPFPCTIRPVTVCAGEPIVLPPVSPPANPDCTYYLAPSTQSVQAGEESSVAVYLGMGSNPTRGYTCYITYDPTIIAVNTGTSAVSTAWGYQSIQFRNPDPYFPGRASIILIDIADVSHSSAIEIGVINFAGNGTGVTSLHFESNPCSVVNDAGGEEYDVDLQHGQVTVAPADTPTSTPTETSSITDTFTDTPVDTETDTPTDTFTHSDTDTDTPACSGPTDTVTDTPTDTPGNPYLDGWEGDGDGTGLVNIFDYFAVKNCLLRNYTCQTECRGTGDGDGNGLVNIFDYFATKNNMLSNYGAFPCEIQPATVCE